MVSMSSLAKLMRHNDYCCEACILRDIFKKVEITTLGSDLQQIVWEIFDIFFLQWDIPKHGLKWL